MIINFLLRIANKRRPDGRGPYGMYWGLFECRWFYLALALHMRSPESNTSRSLVNRWIYLLKGEAIHHRQMDHWDDGRPDSYAYSDELGWMDAKKIGPGALVKRTKGHRGGIELLDARNQSERNLDLAWMNVDEILTDTDRQCWALELVRKP